MGSLGCPASSPNATRHRSHLSRSSPGLPACASQPLLSSRVHTCLVVPVPRPKASRAALGLSPALAGPAPTQPPSAPPAPLRGAMATQIHSSRPPARPGQPAATAGDSPFKEAHGCLPRCYVQPMPRPQPLLDRGSRSHRALSRYSASPAVSMCCVTPMRSPHRYHYRIPYTTIRDTNAMNRAMGGLAAATPWSHAAYRGTTPSRPIPRPCRPPMSGCTPARETDRRTFATKPQSGTQPFQLCGTNWGMGNLTYCFYCSIGGADELHIWKVSSSKPVQFSRRNFLFYLPKSA